MIGDLARSPATAAHPATGAHPATTTAHPASMAPPASMSRDSLRTVLGALDAAGVRWVLLRDPASLEAGDGDVDLLVDPAALGRFEGVLRAWGYVPVRLRGRASHRAYVGLDGDAGRFRWIDVVTRLEFGPWFEWHVPLAGSVLERRAGEGGIWRPAPADAFWALALHALLDGPGTPARHGAALRELAPAAEPAGRWADVIPPRDRRAILEAIAAGDWSGLAAIGRRLRSRPPTRGGPWATALRVARRWGRRAARRFEPLLAGRGRAGLTVALLGPDGAGKSTLAEAIVRAYPFPARVAYLGLWQADRAGGRHWPGRELLPRLAAAWRAWGSGRLRRARGWLVVFDRYPSDALLRAQPGSPWRSRLYFSLIGRSIPTPDLVLVLDAPAAVLQARKPEHPLAEIEADRAGYARLVQRYPRSRHVDVDRPMAEVERGVARAIWSAVVARWPR